MGGSFSTYHRRIFVFPLPSSFAKLAHPLSSFFSDPTYFRENNQPPQEALSSNSTAACTPPPISLQPRGKTIFASYPPPPPRAWKKVFTSVLVQKGKGFLLFWAGKRRRARGPRSSFWAGRENDAGQTFAQKRIFTKVLKPDIFHLICGENFGRQRDESLEGLWNERGVRIRKKSFLSPIPPHPTANPTCTVGYFWGKGEKKRDTLRNFKTQLRRMPLRRRSKARGYGKYNQMRFAEKRLTRGPALLFKVYVRYELTVGAKEKNRASQKKPIPRERMHGRMGWILCIFAKKGEEL